MKKSELLEFLNDLQSLGWKLGLENIVRLLSTMGNPQHAFQAVHIAGSNGKGSTAAILESIFRHAGYRTGLYTSPHLQDIKERIRVNRNMIPQADFFRILAEIKPSIEEIGNTYFEAVTAIAFRYFAEQKIDIGFVEVGLGGRFDATNVIQPLLSIITEISLEHTDHLGKTLRLIALEKAGIIKPHTPCLVQTHNRKLQDVFREVCTSREAEFFAMTDLGTIDSVSLTEDGSRFNLTIADEAFEDLHLSLCGRHQVDNATLVVIASQVLLRKHFSLLSEHIYLGLQNVKWSARLEKILNSPKVIIDVAHNPDSIRQVMRALQNIYEYECLIVIVGLLRDKNFDSIAQTIAAPASQIFTVTPNSERAQSGSKLADTFRQYNKPVKFCETIREAYEQAAKHAGQEGLILVTGSHYTVGDFLNFYKKT